jgi:hypothetical protein
MTATAPTTALHHVGERVRVHRKGQNIPGRITSTHRTEHGIEYLIRTEPTDGGSSEVVNIWTTSGHSSFISPARSTQ